MFFWDQDMIPTNSFTDHSLILLSLQTLTEHILYELNMVHFVFFMSVAKSGKNLLFRDSSGLIINPIYWNFST